MTKQRTPTDAWCDRSAPRSEFGEGFDSIAGQLSQSFERVQNTLTLKELSICEAYIKGRARIAVEFRPHSVAEADGASLFAVWHYDGHGPKTAACGPTPRIKDIKSFYGESGIGRDKNVMLVRDVQSMQAVEIIPSVLEGLYRVQDKSLDCLTWRTATVFMSVEGAFRTLPIFMEREHCVPVDLPSVGFDESAVSVVQGSSQVMNYIANDGGCVGRQAASNDFPFPSLRIGLRAQGFDVLSHVSSDNMFELVDVMVGPFYL